MKINNIIKKLEKEGYEVDYINETVQVGDFDITINKEYKYDTVKEAVREIEEMIANNQTFDIMGFSRTFDIESILIFME